MNSISRDNHYLPQMYLKGWGVKGRVYVYRTVVSNKNVPLWSQRAIKKTAVQQNLYVRIEDNIEHDNIEHWFDKCFEQPATEILQKVCQGKELSANERHILIDFVIAQWVRTPAFHQWTTKQGKVAVPSALDEAAKNLENLTTEKVANHKPHNVPGSNLIPISIKNTGKHLDEGRTLLEVSTVVGKNYWLMSIMYFLSPESEVYKLMHNLKWSIATAPKGFFWPTSDNPFIISRINKAGVFTLRDGIGHKRTVVLFPVNPQKVLIGTHNRKYDRTFVADRLLSDTIKKCIIDNAFMYVYSQYEDSEVCRLRPRIVDSNVFKKNEAEYRAWYSYYKETEAPLLSSRHTIEKL